MSKIKEFFISSFNNFKWEKIDGGYKSSLILSDDVIDDINSIFKGYFDFPDIYIDGAYSEFSEARLFLGRNVDLVYQSNVLESIPFEVYFSWDEFMSYRPNLLNVPEEFIILDTGVSYPEDVRSGKLDNYLKISNFLKILLKMSDHDERMGSDVLSKVIFLHRIRLEIPIYPQCISLDFPLDGISIVDSLLVDESHIEQKRSIFKEVIFGMLINIEIEKRFSYLLENFGEFSTRINENYQLFVSEFSFDKVRIEYEEHKRKYVSSLNDVFSAVQTKMLGIPVALVVVSSNVSKIVDGATFWSNIFLFFSVLAYGVMMIFLLQNQKHTLTSIKTEYTSHMNRLKNQFFEQYEKIESIKTELDQRYRYQSKSICFFYVALAVLFLSVFVFFMWSLPWQYILLGY